MKQTRLSSLAESIENATVGLPVSYGIGVLIVSPFIFPFVERLGLELNGFGLEPMVGWLFISIPYFVAAVVRGYLVRRRRVKLGQ